MKPRCFRCPKIFIYPMVGLGVLYILALFEFHTQPTQLLPDKPEIHQMKPQGLYSTPPKSPTVNATYNTYVAKHAKRGPATKLPNLTIEVDCKRSETFLHDIAVPHRILERLHWTKQQCQDLMARKSFAKRKQQGTVYSHKCLNYCLVQKVGCTFWKRVIRFLNKDFFRFASSPLDIPRTFVHYAKYTKTSVYELKQPDVIPQIQGFNVMFSRDPYSRLWSAYLDKFYLPDFWKMHGKQIISRIRPNASEYALSCGNDLRFEEFLQYVVKELKLGRDVNRHFLPVHRLCSPCHLDFDVIGKLETFADDVSLIVDRVGLSRTIKYIAAMDNIEEEVKTLLDYNLKIARINHKMQGSTNCYDALDIAVRLWKTFQFNGYLDLSFKFPYEQITTLHPVDFDKTFTNIVLNLTRHNGRTNGKKQRRNSLIHAYKHIPTELVKDLQTVYENDFLLFDYDNKPPHG